MRTVDVPGAIYIGEYEARLREVDFTGFEVLTIPGMEARLILSRNLQ